LTISELSGALREVNLTLEQTRMITANAVRLLTEARATLTAALKDTDGYQPIELDLAMSQLGTAGDQIAGARQSILDYLMRL
jgi:hypothetical protein